MLSFIVFCALALSARAYFPQQQQQFPIDLDALTENQKMNTKNDNFLHTKPFFDMIHADQRKTVLYSSQNVLENGTASNYKSLSVSAHHNTSTTIELLSGVKYFSLNNEKTVQHIREIGHDYLIDCANKPRIGDYYIGTSESKHEGVLLHSNHGSQKGFVFSKKVIRIENNVCAMVFTEPVHPLLIMNTKIESKITFPYDRIYVPDNRDLIESSAFMEPDSPLMLCDDEKVLSKLGTIHKDGSDSKTVKGIPIDYTYALDLKGNECLSASVTVPGSINFNHGSGTNAIRKNLLLSPGVTCTNCYAFLGASVLAVVNIFGGDLATFAFEAKDEGGAGFNLDILIKDPSFSASKYINLAGTGPVSSVPLAYGLSLDVNFAGAWATVKGSGSARGQASFSSGYTLLEEDYIMYAKSRWSSSHTLINSNRLTPTYTSKGFSLSSVSLSTIISMSARVKYSFGGSVPVIGIGASVDFSTVLTATTQYLKWAKSYSLSFEEDRRELLDKVYYTGDKYRFNIKYTGLNPNENHELYFNLRQQPVHLHKFKSSSSGNGSVNVEWNIPHDSKIVGSAIISVHSSARLDRFNSMKKINIYQKREPYGESVFTFPKKDDIIVVDQPVFLIWNKNAMRYFEHKQGTDGLGAEKSPALVSIVLVCEDTKTAYKLANNIENTGSHISVFPENLMNIGKRFFLVIHDADEYSKIHWMRGTFSLKRRFFRSHKYAVKAGSFPIANIEPPVLENGNPLWNNTALLIINKNTSYEQHRYLAGSNSCPNSAISVMLQLEFGFDGFTLLGHRSSLGSTRSNPFTIIPQKNFCV